MALEGAATSFEPKPFGRYVLMDKLAVGGMAEIYKAKTYGVDGFEKLLAIKRILPHCSADKEFINMLVDEAKLTVLLSHANIVQVFDLGKVGDDYFISMEFINGTNLRELMNRISEQGESFPEEISVYIMSELCKGLDYAHRKTDSRGQPLNIVHRDISPQNVLISYEGEVKIVDFGIAKAAMNVSHTMAGILKGKIAYMSPEQALGKPIDHKTDIFSAGVLLYEMLTGEKLFSGETQFEVLNQIRTTRINTLMLPESIPGPLKAILAKALAYNVKDRYQSAGDFQLDLTKYLYSSYIDFSPRQLAAILRKLFEKEIRRAEGGAADPHAPQAPKIDEKTRSVMVKEQNLENIMVHGTDRMRAQENAQNTAVSGLYAAPTVKKRLVPKLALTASIVVLLLGGFLGYKFFFKGTKQQASLSPRPVAPTTSSDNLPLEETGTIQVTTTPAGAKIFLNDADTGLVTPATLSKLAVGDEYQIRAEKESYRTYYKTVSITSQTPVVLEQTLQPLSRGVIEIDSNPRGAKIILNGQDTGLVTPNKVDGLEVQKNYGMKLTLPNYYEWAGSVDVKDLTPVKLQASLTPMVASTPQVPQTPPVQIPQTPIQTPPQQPQAALMPQTPQLIPPAQPPTTPVEKPPVAYGKIRVTSDPAGGRILLNGQGTGRTTPATLENLEAGKRVTIGIVRDGYKDWSRTLTVEGNKTASLPASLKAIEQLPIETPQTPPQLPKEPPVVEKPSVEGGAPGSISVSSDPSGAEVYINSELKGTTPLKISHVGPGNVRVIVSKEGHMKYATTVHVGSGESKSLGTVKLGSPYGEISVKSTPPRADVIFDGESIGAKTPVTIRRVPRDRGHSLKVQLDGYRGWSTSVNLKDSDSKKYDVMLEKD